MPFRSEKQRRFMWAKHPRIARRWTKEQEVGKGTDLVGIAKAYIPAGLARRHGGGLFLHGTGTAEAAAIARTGLRESPGGMMGRGTYLSDSMEWGNMYGSHHGNGIARSAKGKRVGKVLAFKPKAPPAQAPPTSLGGPGADREYLFRQGDVGKPVHTQNVNRTSTLRTMARRRGEAPLPKTGYVHPAPTPVSQLGPEGIAARRQALWQRKNPMSIPGMTF